MPARHPDTRPRPRRPMPLRHKLMLALACELLLVGFRQADRNPHHVGISVETPDRAHHVVT